MDKHDIACQSMREDYECERYGCDHCTCDKSGTWYQRWLNRPSGQWWNASDESHDSGEEA